MEGSFPSQEKLIGDAGYPAGLQYSHMQTPMGIHHGQQQQQLTKFDHQTIASGLEAAGLAQDKHQGTEGMTIQDKEMPSNPGVGGESVAGYNSEGMASDLQKGYPQASGVDFDVSALIRMHCAKAYLDACTSVLNAKVQQGMAKLHGLGESTSAAGVDSVASTTAATTTPEVSEKFPEHQLQQDFQVLPDSTEPATNKTSTAYHTRPRRKRSCVSTEAAAAVSYAEGDLTDEEAAGPSSSQRWFGTRKRKGYKAKKYTRNSNTSQEEGKIVGEGGGEGSSVPSSSSAASSSSSSSALQTPSARVKKQPGDKPYKCEHCDMRFPIPSALKKHNRKHTGEKPYQCTICQTRFTRATGLKTHYLTHTGERPHKCYFCDARFTRYDHLKMHIMTHTGEKPHKCDFCDARFARQTHLKTHRMSHTGEWPYKCDICNAQFAYPEQHRAHAYSHTGVRPYKCDICDAGFVRAFHLKTHKMTHTGEKPHKCVVCDARFTRPFHLKRHEKTHMKEIMQVRVGGMHTQPMLTQ